MYCSQLRQSHWVIGPGANSRTPIPASCSLLHSWLHGYTNEYTSALEQKSQWREFLPGHDKQGCILSPKEKIIHNCRKKYLQFNFPGISYLIPCQWAVSRQWEMLVNSPMPVNTRSFICVDCGSYQCSAHHICVEYNPILCSLWESGNLQPLPSMLGGRTLLTNWSTMVFYYYAEVKTWSWHTESKPLSFHSVNNTHPFMLFSEIQKLDSHFWKYYIVFSYLSCPTICCLM